MVGVVIRHGWHKLKDHRFVSVMRPERATMVSVSTLFAAASVTALLPKRSA
jgi:hypothetical protein